MCCDLRASRSTLAWREDLKSRFESPPCTRGRRDRGQETYRHEYYTTGSGTRDPIESHRSVCMFHDTQTDILNGDPKSAICVQRFDDSHHSAIHITYRNWLRSSSIHEPRDPPSAVVSRLVYLLSPKRLEQYVV